MSKEDSCQLCGRMAKLQESHILPKFIYKDFKKDSPTGRMRATNAPNLPIEDGEKEYLLCWNCEQLFSKWEREFQMAMYSPLHTSEGAQPIYGPWLEKFAVSVSWRVLLFYKLHNGLGHIPNHLMPSVHDAFNAWKSYLLGISRSIGSFEQHLLFFSPMASTDVPGLSPYLNRYLLRTINVEVVQAGDTALVFSKMCRVAILGFIKKREQNSWVNTKIHSNGGQLKSLNQLFPEGFLWFLSGRAQEAHAALKSLSPKQRLKMQEAIRKNKDRLSQSEIVRALRYDVNLFGEELAIKGSQNIAGQPKTYKMEGKDDESE